MASAVLPSSMRARARLVSPRALRGRLATTSAQMDWAVRYWAFRWKVVTPSARASANAMAVSRQTRARVGPVNRSRCGGRSAMRRRASRR